MSAEFLSNFLLLAQSVTEAERGLAVDADLNMQDAVNIDEAELKSRGFRELADETMRQAMTDSDAIITNNIITDPEDAPKTNTSFAHLRVVVAFPVANIGAIYLDQHIRQGVIEKDVLDRLAALAQQVVRDNQTDLNVDALRQLYDAIPSDS